jgi:hypothetical protein
MNRDFRFAPTRTQREGGEMEEERETMDDFGGGTGPFDPSTMLTSTSSVQTGRAMLTSTTLSANSTGWVRADRAGFRGRVKISVDFGGDGG